MSEQKDELIIAKRVKKDSLVVTRNTMAYASYSNDPNQEKLMFAAMIVIRKLELENKGPIDPNSKIRISARNYAELTHKKVISGETTALEEAELKLIEKTADKALLRIYNKFQPLIMKVKEPDSPVPAKVPMITYCKYIAKSKSIDIRFAPEFYEYFYRVLVDQADDKKLDGYFSHELKQVTQLDG
ncbi:TPA: replication initiation protein, partial [Acinetobacter baumannii]|nr:replication initiation protein [Acinetobacter baumannii]